MKISAKFPELGENMFLKISEKSRSISDHSGNTILLTAVLLQETFMFSFIQISWIGMLQLLTDDDTY